MKKTNTDVEGLCMRNHQSFLCSSNIFMLILRTCTRGIKILKRSKQQKKKNIKMYILAFPSYYDFRFQKGCCVDADSTILVHHLWRASIHPLSV
jgi:hypothetical protein